MLATQEKLYEKQRVSMILSMRRVAFLLLLLPSLSLATWSSLAQSTGASFKTQVVGTMTEANQSPTPLEFEISFTRKRYEHTFVIARNSFKVHELPKHYIVVLTKTNQDQVIVSEFSDSPLSAFDIKINDERISFGTELVKNKLTPVINLNRFKYDFSGDYAMLEFTFSQEGIARISVKGVKRIRL